VRAARCLRTQNMFCSIARLPTTIDVATYSRKAPLTRSGRSLTIPCAVWASYDSWKPHEFALNREPPGNQDDSPKNRAEPTRLARSLVH
jgi:hypothetical protein